MNNQLAQPVAVIVNLPARPVRFVFQPSQHLATEVSRVEVANVATALYAALTPEAREGLTLLAVALGLEVER